MDGPDGNNADYAAFLAKYYAAIPPNAETAAEKVGNLPLYAGYWWDAQLEMYHVRHRVYRPEWGKWIQRDPLGYAAGWNLYEYVGGEPWREIDPEGLLSWGDAWTITKEALKGAGDGVLIIANALTFKQIDSLNEHVEDLVEQNGWTYSVSQFAADVAREALLAAGTMGWGSLARGGTALAKYNSMVQIAKYTFPLVITYDIVTGTQQIGNGIGKLMEGDSSGWQDIVFGGLRVFGGYTAGRGTSGRRLTDLDRLRKHLRDAQDDFRLFGYTVKQASRVKINPKTAPMFKGERIDKYFRDRVAKDPALDHLELTRRGRFGPDVVDRTKGIWYDVTTPGQWLDHVKKYTPRFGPGTPLCY